MKLKGLGFSHVFEDIPHLLWDALEYLNSECRELYRLEITVNHITINFECYVD